MTRSWWLGFHRRGWVLAVAGLFVLGMALWSVAAHAADEDEDEAPATKAAATKESEKAGAPPAPFVQVDGPPTLLLTWAHDPTTTMTVEYLLLRSTTPDANWLKLSYCPTGLFSDNWQTASFKKTKFPQPATSPKNPPKAYDVYALELTGLKPDTTYKFHFGDAKAKEKDFKFRTAPADDKHAINFASGGDAGSTMNTAKIFDQIAKSDPLFALCGGDVAYSNGGDPLAWFNFLNNYRGHMVHDGRLIPLVCAIGNHEVVKGFKQKRDKAEQFLSLFPLLSERSYATLDFGKYMSLFCLDSWHTTPIEGEQTTWLEQALKERASVPIKIPLYHVPAWPSYRKFDDGGSPFIRDNWCPLFYQYQVTVVLEHHDHDYKRTIPIAGTQPAKDGEKGITYIGDGGWGRSLRRPRTTGPTWYIDKSMSALHFLSHTVKEGKYSVKIIDVDGKEIDRYEKN